MLIVNKNGNNLWIEDCPFCKSKELSLSADMKNVSVKCDKCGAKGPEAVHSQMAVALWNLAIRPVEAQP